MSPKGLRYPFIKIKIKISLKKLFLLKYTRNKLDFLPLIGPSLYTKVLK